MLKVVLTEKTPLLSLRLTKTGPTIKATFRVLRVKLTAATG